MALLLAALAPPAGGARGAPPPDAPAVVAVARAPSGLGAATGRGHAPAATATGRTTADPRLDAPRTQAQASGSGASGAGAIREPGAGPETVPALIDPPGTDPPGTDPAVGRLNHAGHRARRHCTAALVGPREAVTARHCVEGLEVEGLHLLLGYARGAYAEHRRVARVVASPSEDVARLCLDAPSLAAPLRASRAPPAAGAARARGYPASRPHRQAARACRLAPLDGRALALLDCPLEPGFSGAPVSTGGAVVGVASASGEAGSVVALLSALPEGGCADP